MVFIFTCFYFFYIQNASNVQTKVARFSSWLRKYEKAVEGHIKKEGILRGILENFGIKKSTLLDYIKQSKPSMEEASASANEEPQSLSINFPMKAKHNRQVFDMGHKRKLANYFWTCSTRNLRLTTKQV